MEVVNKEVKGNNMGHINILCKNCDEDCGLSLGFDIRKTVIGICGKPGSGKDTIGSYMEHNMGFKIFNLKTPIEQVVKNVFNIDNHSLYEREAREEPLKEWPGWTARKMLQAVGQTMRELAGGDVWAKSLCQRIDGENSRLSVVTDVRTPEDAEYIRKHVESGNGRFILIMVKRPGFGATTAGGFANHKLESYDLEQNCDLVFENDGTQDELFKKVKQYLETQNIYEIDDDADIVGKVVSQINQGNDKL